MDLLKSAQKSEKCQEHPHVIGRYLESKAGHLFVSNVNPFSNNNGGHACDVKHNLNYLDTRGNEEFNDIFENTPTKEPCSTPSKEIVNEIMRNCSFDRTLFMKDPYEVHDALLIGDQSTDGLYPQPITSMSANILDTQYTSCSKYTPKPPRYDDQVSFGENNEENDRHKTLTNDRPTDYHLKEVNGRAEKTTYCRPLLNTYNKEFVYKTMQRNARLQKLVRKLVIVREKEKQKEAWNNYINELKNKHGYYSNEPTRISPQYVPDEHVSPELIDDFYNTRFTWRQSNPCQNLLEDFYRVHNSLSPNIQDRYPGDYVGLVPPEDSETHIYDNNSFCYPTSSQANLLRWNKERQDNHFGRDWRCKPSSRYFRGNTVVVGKEQNNMFDRIQGTNRPYHACPQTIKKCSCKNKMCSIIRSSSKPIQTDITLPLVNAKGDRDINDQITKETVCCKDDKGIYFPYKISVTLTNDQSINIPSIEDNSEMIEYDKDMNIPIEEESLDKDRTLNNNKYAKVGHEENTLHKNTDVNVTLKEEILNKNIDANIPDKDVLTEEQDVVAKQAAVKNDKIEKESEKRDSLKDKFKEVTENLSKLKDKIRETEEEARLKSLVTIEEKINSLMKSINSIMIEIKTDKNIFHSKRNTAVSCAFISNSRSNLKKPRGGSYDLINNREYLYGFVQGSSKSLTVSEVAPSENLGRRESTVSKIDKILLEEIKKSNKVKKDIEELLNLRNEKNCSMQITFDIPTKECSTEVTDSLCKARLESGTKVIVEEIKTEGVSNELQPQMTIAVNTDPLGWLALLRISTETIKQLLSYVPQLNYNSYLSMLPTPPRKASHYICNICGAAFGRPSQLSDHIEQHNLGRTRDCCVCRHTLDVQRNHMDLFTCQYCGQRFTRAYCCELHQQTCAKQLGRSHDVNSSHLLLR